MSIQNENTPLDDELPMVVHLRGDEEYVSEFSVDADEAMAQLGIKRSRLTQISGKDLRVGRIRKDRYIRPVYRVSDLEQYLSWTRATATHKNSSETVKRSVDELEQRIEDQICSRLESSERTVVSVTKSLHEQQRSLIDNRLRRLSEAVIQESTCQRRSQTTVKKLLDELFASLSEIDKRQKGETSVLEQLNKTVHDLKVSLAKHNEQHAQSLESLCETQSLLAQKVAIFGESLELMLGRIHQLETQLSKLSETQDSNDKPIKPRLLSRPAISRRPRQKRSF